MFKPLELTIIYSVTFVIALAFGTPNSFAAEKTTSNTLNIAIFGDAPYGTSPTDTAEFNATPAFINNINADPDVSLVLMVGDIHSGSQYCTEAYDRSIYDLWTTFLQPLVYTPGDNEWSDCHKVKEGGGSYSASTDKINYVVDASGNPVNYANGNPAKNLDLVRSIFFANPGHTIGGDMRVLSQAEVSADESSYTDSSNGNAATNDQKFVENVMWKQADVLFITLNIPGGSNNNADIWYGTPTMSLEQAQEITDRSNANLRWLELAFKKAKTANVKAVVIQTQADMWDLDGKPASHVTNYKPFVDSIAANTKALGKPVLLLNGDSHTYRSDNPLVKGAPCATETTCANDAYASQPYGYNVPNFHRVVVHGSIFPLEWLKLKIDHSNTLNDANNFGPFSWKRVVQQ